MRSAIGSQTVSIRILMPDIPVCLGRSIISRSPSYMCAGDEVVIHALCLIHVSSLHVTLQIIESDIYISLVDRNMRGVRWRTDAA